MTAIEEDFSQNNHLPCVLHSVHPASQAFIAQGKNENTWKKPIKDIFQ